MTRLWRTSNGGQSEISHNGEKLHKREVYTRSRWPQFSSTEHRLPPHRSQTSQCYLCPGLFSDFQDDDDDVDELYRWMAGIKMETCSVSMCVSLAKDPGVSAKALYVYIPINQGKITVTTHRYSSNID